MQPASEATSLLLRVARNCPWGRCAFCAIYRGQRYQRRPLPELLADVDALASLVSHVQQQLDANQDGRELLVFRLLADPALSAHERRVIGWCYGGDGRVFLQDADVLSLPKDDLESLLRYLRSRVPGIRQVLAYARSNRLVRLMRQGGSLERIREAGLDRLHVGIESGNTSVLRSVTKGVTPADHLAGCVAAQSAGFELCCTLMPGLGGRTHSADHARDSADLLRAIAPKEIRLRTLWLEAGTPLHEQEAVGNFEALEEDEVVAEIRSVLVRLDGTQSWLFSDYEGNLLPELAGDLAADANRLLDQCDRLLTLPQHTRDAFVVARRTGRARNLTSFLAQPELAERVGSEIKLYRKLGGGSLARGLHRVITEQIAKTPWRG